VDVERLYYHDLTCLIGECSKPCQNKESSRCNYCTPKKYYINDVILSKAKSGDKESQHHIILSLIPVVFKYAMKMQDAITPTIEFISIGNAALVIRMQDALNHPNPCAYLLKFAKMDMMEYKYRERYIIKVPVGQEPYISESMSKEFDVVEEAPLAEQQSDNTVLYKALSSLPTERARDIVTRLFGLNDHPEEDLREVAGGNSASKQYNALKWSKRDYLEKMLRFLEDEHPEYVIAHTKT
jgi:hypothetical protein